MRVLGRVEKFRDRLQLDVRTLEASDVDPVSLTPAMRRDTDELQGFLDYLAGEISHEGLAATVRAVLADCELAAYPATPDDHHSYAGGLLEHTVGVATLCRETAQLHPRLRADLLLAAALVHDAGRTVELSRGPAFTPTEEGRLLGHVHLGLRLIDERAEGLTEGRAAATTTRGRPAALYHANQLDAPPPCVAAQPHDGCALGADWAPRRPSCTTRTSSTRSPTTHGEDIRPIGLTAPPPAGSPASPGSRRPREAGRRVRLADRFGLLPADARAGSADPWWSLDECGLQRSSIRRTFQTANESAHVKTKSPTIP